jgi:hypothetical protein
MKSVSYGHKERGIVHWHGDGDLTARFLEQLPEGYSFQIVAELYYPKRTQYQNRYYWGVVLDAISKETGMPADMLHSALLAKFSVQPALIEGSEAIVTTSSGMNTKQFSEYVDKVKQWALEALKITIPEAGESFTE